MDIYQADESPDTPPDTQSRAWLAALLLRQHRSWFGRFAARLQQLTTLGRGQRRHLQRKAAVSLAGAALVLSLGAGMLAHPAAVHADAITVTTNTANGFVADGFCSLSEAIVNANDGAQTYADCEAGGAFDNVITLSGNTYTLNNFYGAYQYYGDNGLPAVTSAITIEGNGATIERNAAAAVFRIVLVGADGSLTLKDSTISGGAAQYGGNIFNNGTLDFINGTITQGYAFGGGGLLSGIDAATFISYSTIQNNYAPLGGGLVNNLGRLSVANSTVSGNYAGIGGGVLMVDGFTEILSTTITGNTASDYGGGISSFEGHSYLTLARSIVSGNLGTGSTAAYEIFLPDATATSNYNVVGHAGLTDAEAFINFTPDASDFNATSDDHNVPLGNILNTTLADNGGPTLTHALVSGSPAIDVVPGTYCYDYPFVNDQRHLPRNVDIPGTGNEGGDNLCDVGAFELQLTVAGGFCPVDPAVGYERTDLIGTGQGSLTKGYRTRKLIIPDSDNVVALYGQLAAVDVGTMKYVRFLYPNGTKLQIKDPISPAYRRSAVSWWGDDLTPSKFIKGQFFWGAKANKSPRAFVLWPTYDTGETAYANVFQTFADSSHNHVAWETGFIATQSQVIDIPETQADGATVTVQFAIVDNNKDTRPLNIDVTVGSETQSSSDTVPNMKDTLNLYELTFTNVPAGVDHVTIDLESPLGTGDSAAIIGAAVNYECAIDTP